MIKNEDLFNILLFKIFKVEYGKVYLGKEVIETLSNLKRIDNEIQIKSESTYVFDTLYMNDDMKSLGMILKRNECNYHIIFSLLNDNDYLDTIVDSLQKIEDSIVYIINKKKIEKISNELNLFLNDSPNFFYDFVSSDSQKIKINPSECALFLGAGCSIDANIGNWNDLCNSLSTQLLTYTEKFGLNSYSNSKINNAVLKKLEGAYDKNSIIDIVKNEKELLPNEIREQGEIIFYISIYESLYANYSVSKKSYKTSLLTSIANCIDRLKMQYVFTYNFDSALESCIDENYHSTSLEIKNAMTRFKSKKGNETIIYHIHGYLPYDYDKITIPGNFVLSDYDFYWIDNEENICQSLNNTQKFGIQNKDIIFIGLSFTDQNLKNILRSLDTNRNIYAIVKKPKFDFDKYHDKENKIALLKYMQIIEDYYLTFKTKIIWIDEFEEIPQILDLLKYDDKEVEFEYKKSISKKEGE